MSSYLNPLLVKLNIINPRSVPTAALHSRGYRLESVGPERMVGKELDEVRRRAEAIQGAKLEGPYAVGGVPRSRCPFAK